METPFTKMHGLGNDFVIFDGVRSAVQLDRRQIQRLADRRFGIGCDQLLLVEPATIARADFRYRIFNADGNEVEQCGNGARCFARFVYDQGLTDKSELSVQTLGGLIETKLETDGRVTVNIGIPEFMPEKVPFEADSLAPEYDLDVNGKTIQVSVLSMGNPHAVQQVADIDMAPVSDLGPVIEAHSRFPKRVNAGFMQIIDRRQIALRVYERGVGETLACGSGACAAVVAGRQKGVLDETVSVRLLGGELQISWAADGEPVWMTGPAVKVFEGSIDLNQL